MLLKQYLSKDTEFMEAGYQAQLKSVVLLKNTGNVLPIMKEQTIYIPERFIPASRNFFGREQPSRNEAPINPDLASKYFKLTENPEEAEVAVVVINNPNNGRTAGYSTSDAESGGNGFLPISLMYGSYTAIDARETSLAGDSGNKMFSTEPIKAKQLKPIIRLIWI